MLLIAICVPIKLAAETATRQNDKGYLSCLPERNRKYALHCHPLTVVIVVTPDLHELSGGKVLKLTSVLVAKLAHKVLPVGLVVVEL